MHVRNWLAAVKDNKEPSSPIELGHRVITAAHLANIAYRTAQESGGTQRKEQIVSG